MPVPNLVCLVVERLHAGLVGAYGNSWIGTRAIDRFASESFVFDQAYLESTRLDAAYNALWQGHHAAAAAPAEPYPPLPKQLRAAGWHTALVTDSPAVAARAAAVGFDEHRLIESPSELRAAVDVADSTTARLFAAANQWLQTAPPPFLLWIHARGLAGPWDAPWELRDRFAEEDDPAPPKLVEVPDFWLPDDFDPDEPLGIKHAAAGQVALLDACFGSLLEGLDTATFADRTLLSLMSTAGFPLGEHRRIGRCDDALYNENSQLVWMMRFPDGLGRLARSQALVQPSDFPAAVFDWLALPFAGPSAGSGLLSLIRDDCQYLRQAAVMIGPHDRALRTPAWHLRLPLTGAAELYAKPSDRWEVNEVSKLLPDIALGLQAALEDCVAQVQSHPTGAFDPVLLEPVD